jgi:NAD(P)-dependent dehydrogenase (short-subunit alcohol dehydrogenase family)
MGVNERVAVVTGAGQGIGAAIAATLARGGARVVVNDIDAERARATAERLAQSGAAVVAAAADVSHAEGARRVVERALADFGRLDIFVNNAAITRDAPLDAMTEADWDEVLGVNLRAAFLCCQQAVPHMATQRHGRIVNIGSRAWLGGTGQFNYAASKGGLIALTRTLALEVAARKITVNAIAPSTIDAPLLHAAPADVRERMVASVPVGRIGQPADVAWAVLFFASDEAGFVTGQTLYVCGGRSLAAY